jgi:hypothetical protein
MLAPPGGPGIHVAEKSKMAPASGSFTVTGSLLRLLSSEQARCRPEARGGSLLNFEGESNVASRARGPLALAANRTASHGGRRRLLVPAPGLPPTEACAQPRVRPRARRRRLGVRAFAPPSGSRPARGLRLGALSHRAGHWHGRAEPPATFHRCTLPRNLRTFDSRVRRRAGDTWLGCRLSVGLRLLI